jgi:seryl-tRNA synthetase
LINFGTQFLLNKSFEGDDKKYEVLQPPFFMKKELMAGIAQLEDFDEQLYKVKRVDELGRKRKRIAWYTNWY